MSLNCGFFNSVNNDRVYDAEEISSMFDGLIKDGIYVSIDGQLKVSINNGMTVKIAPGRAWFNHTWTYNDSYYNIELDASDPLLNRIDAVVLEIDHSIGVRANNFKIVKGESATNPTRPELIHTSDVNQYALAYINVPANATQISANDIISVVGSRETPYVTGVVENMIAIEDMIEKLAPEFAKKQNKVRYGTTDLEPNVSELPTNDIYVVYE